MMLQPGIKQNPKTMSGLEIAGIVVGTAQLASELRKTLAKEKRRAEEELDEYDEPLGVIPIFERSMDLIEVCEEYLQIHTKVVNHNLNLPEEDKKTDPRFEKWKHLDPDLERKLRPLLVRDIALVNQYRVYSRDRGGKYAWDYITGKQKPSGFSFFLFFACFGGEKKFKKARVYMDKTMEILKEMHEIETEIGDLIASN